MNRLLATVAVLAGAATLCSGCFFVDPAVCPEERYPALRIAVHDKNDRRVRPDRIVVSKSGGGVRTVDASCPALPYASAFREATTYTVRAVCGNQRVEKTVSVQSNECGAMPRQVKLVFPTDACRTCADIGAPPDATFETGTPDAGRDTTDATSPGDTAGGDVLDTRELPPRDGF